MVVEHGFSIDLKKAKNETGRAICPGALEQAGKYSNKMLFFQKLNLR
jgi:hypothetical protein